MNEGMEHGGRGTGGVLCCRYRELWHARCSRVTLHEGVDGWWRDAT